MATRLELEQCFEALRKEAQTYHETTYGRLTGDDKREVDRVWLIVQMGMFIAESVFVDIKRIADALERFDDVASRVPEFQRQVKEVLGIRE